MHEVQSVAEARSRLPEIIARVRATGRRIMLEERGEAVAALVSALDLQAIEALEDRLDLLDALDALADYRSRGGVAFADLKADLGI